MEDNVEAVSPGTAPGWQIVGGRGVNRLLARACFLGSGAKLATCVRCATRRPCSEVACLVERSRWVYLGSGQGLAVQVTWPVLTGKADGELGPPLPGHSDWHLYQRGRRCRGA